MVTLFLLENVQSWLLSKNESHVWIPESPAGGRVSWVTVLHSHVGFIHHVWHFEKAGSEKKQRKLDVCIYFQHGWIALWVTSVKNFFFPLLSAFFKKSLFIYFTTVRRLFNSLQAQTHTQLFCNRLSGAFCFRKTFFSKTIIQISHSSSAVCYPVRFSHNLPLARHGAQCARNAAPMFFASRINDDNNKKRMALGKLIAA